jgi:hypothetical protein
VAPLPAGIRGHFGVDLHRYVLALYHRAGSGRDRAPGAGRVRWRRIESCACMIGGVASYGVPPRV